MHQQFHGHYHDDAFLVDLLPDLVKNYEAWETGWTRNNKHIGGHDNGLFYQIDALDGGEVSIGGHGFRPTVNSFMYGDARAIAAISRMAGNEEQAKRFDAKAAAIKKLVQEKLWDEEAQFFKILSDRTGELVDVSIDDRGPDSLQVGDRVLPARQYRITMEDGTIDLWYHSDTGQWLALEAPTEGGRVLRYEPVGLPPVQGGEDRLAMD